ncbi:HAMP domain-containing histidine kinase [bacterium]|nr:HAMP domain-containing histidine kinase [bacterium]
MWRIPRFRNHRSLQAVLATLDGLPGEETTLLQALVDHLGFEQAGLYRREPQAQVLSWVAGAGPGDRGARRELPLEAMENGLALVDGFVSGLPLKGHRQTVGLLVLGRRKAGVRLSEAERQTLAQACALFALGLENQWLGRARIDQRLAALKAQEESELQQRLNAVVSHQLKTPLLVGQGMLKDAIDAIDDRTRVAKRLDKLITSLTRFERNVMQNFDRNGIALDRYQLDVRAVPLAALIGRCLDDLRYPLKKREGRLLIEVPSHVEVLADRARLEIVFDNLFSNALKVLPTGGSLEVSAHLTDDHAEIRVRDTGPGICEARRDALFERQPPNPQDPTSTGVGLSICREYMTAMQGAIALEATGPEGTTFRLTLRLA